MHVVKRTGSKRGGEGEEPGREVRNGRKYWAGGWGGVGGVFAGKPIFLIQSEIQMSLYIWLYCSSFA